MVAYNLRKVENRDRYPDPPQFFCSSDLRPDEWGPRSALPFQRIGAAEARWAHNPKVLRSKRRFAIFAPLALFKLKRQAHTVFAKTFHSRARKKKVLPGIEPGFRDSESPVITVTLQDLKVCHAT